MSARFVLVLNCGSSSLKFAVFDAGEGAAGLSRRPVFGGKVEGIGGPAPTLQAGDDAPRALALGAAQPAHDALAAVLALLRERLQGAALAGVAHRVVHGGAHHSAPLLVDAAALAELRSYIPLAPLHQPYALQAIEILLQDAPDVPQVACFDTAFHHTVPKVEQMLALPRALWDEGVRRYGFH
ncbi:MAG TPA: acetate kinase, partial [Burkholderiaceae bacterium]